MLVYIIVFIYIRCYLAVIYYKHIYISNCRRDELRSSCYFGTWFLSPQNKIYIKEMCYNNIIISWQDVLRSDVHIFKLTVLSVIFFKAGLANHKGGRSKEKKKRADQTSHLTCPKHFEHKQRSLVLKYRLISREV